MTNELDRQLQEKLAAVIDANAWIKPEVLTRHVSRIRNENASYKNRRTKLIRLADRFNAAIAPQATCGPGCSACCSMPTMIYEHEAKALAEASGKPIARVPFQPRAVALARAEDFLGTPCPFLTGNRCSVYEARPIICRLHHSFNEDASACDTRVPLEARPPITNYDVDIIELPYHRLADDQKQPEPWATIHEFFSDSLGSVADPQ